jgi:hypothetical protein
MQGSARLQEIRASLAAESGGAPAAVAPAAENAAIENRSTPASTVDTTKQPQADHV